jgi:ATP/maltotriose-dependent transcriptional regulator MalT
VTGAAIEIGHYAELTERLAHPIGRWHLCVRRAMRALLDGRFNEGEALATEAYERGARLDPRTADGFRIIQRFAVLRERGGLDELAETISRYHEISPNQPGWAAILAAVRVGTGRREEARGLVQRLSTDRFTALNRDYTWVGCMMLVAEVCAELGEVDVARSAYPLLLPYADRAALVGRAGISLGSASRALGMLAALIGRPGAAERHFEDALRANTRMGAAPFVAHTSYAYSRLLQARGAAGDAERAAVQRDRAVTIADELGMARLAAAARATRPPAGLTTRELEVLRHIAAGRSNQQIAHSLVISLNTVLRHVSHILAKTGSTNRTQAAQYATRHGLLE